MHLQQQTDQGQEKQFFIQDTVLRMMILAFLFLLAFNMRLYHLDDPPLEYHPSRQYHSAIIARAYYYDTLGAVPQWKREIANLNRKKEGLLEPPVTELLAAFIYRIAGGERLWIPRLFSSLFWLIGGAFLYRIAKRLVSTDAAVFSTAYYLFVPYGVLASRSFQPEPLMTMMVLMSILTILRYNDKPSIARLAVIVTVTAAALLVKPQCAIQIFVLFISIEISKKGFIRAFLNRDAALYFVISLLPVLAYYIYGVFISGSLQGRAEGRFIFHVLLSGFFWSGWLSRAEIVFGPMGIIGALLGLTLASGRLQKTVIAGLLASYLIFGIIFSYSIHTHDYYHLQYIPMVALCLGPLADSFLSRFNAPEFRFKLRRAAVICIFVIVIIASMRETYPRLLNQSADNVVSTCRIVGQLVNHSRRTIFLTWGYGAPLEYHGEISGRWWPAYDDFNWEKLKGLPELSAEQRFNKIYLGDSPEYFIITDSGEFRKQSDLRDFLAKNFAILAKTNSFLIFDLKKKPDRENFLQNQ